MKYILILFFMISSLVYSQSIEEFNKAIKEIQSTDIPKPRLNPYESADSIKSHLIKAGVDTVMLFYKTDNISPLIDKSERWIDEHKKAFIIWNFNDTLFIQRVNEYAIYKPIRVKKSNIDLSFLFNYYSDHRDIIKNEQINSVGYYRFARIAGDDLLKMTLTDNPLIIIDVKMSEDTFKTDFNDIHKLYYNDSKSFYEDLDKKLYIWTLLIEKELREELKTRTWTPYRMEYISDEEKLKIINQMEKEFLDN